MKKKRPKAAPVAKSKGLIGRTVFHTTNGEGTVKSFDGTLITVHFKNGQTKTLNYKMCMEKNLLRVE